MKKDTVTVFFTVDNNYAPYLGVAVNSMVKNADPRRRYRVIVLNEDICDENKRKISEAVPENFIVEYAEMSRGLEAISDRMGNRLRCDYFTLTIYYRLFIAEMYPELDKAVYIDSDVVLTSDIAELYDTELGNNLIGACRDLSVAGVPELCYYMEEGVGVPREEYVNSGVLLMNLKAMREEGFEEHFLTLLTTYAFDTIAPDQDYINAICNGRILYLSDEWDRMPDGEERGGAKLIHYNLFSKPWCYDGVSYGDVFWKYAYGSGFFDELCAFKLGYNDEKKKSDGRCLELLVKRGSEIPSQDVTFKKMHDGGKKIRL